MPITPSPAVVRACEVLRHLARHSTAAFSVSELARELGVPRATCDAVLHGLAEGGFVTRRAGDLRYELGAACITVGDAARAANPVLRATSGEAERLARTLSACTAVSVRGDDGSHVAEVFDFGPPFGPRAQVGQSIPHTPPFGAIYVAWDQADADAWISRAGTSLDAPAVERYRRALAEVRTRGFSVTLATSRRPELASALAALASARGTANPRETANANETANAQRTRNEIIAELVHSEYLATDLDADARLRVSHMAAPVFDRTGRAVASLLLVGPEFEITTGELRTRGEHLVRAAATATRNAGGVPPAAGV